MAKGVLDWGSADRAWLPAAQGLREKVKAAPPQIPNARQVSSVITEDFAAITISGVPAC